MLTLYSQHSYWSLQVCCGPLVTLQGGDPGLRPGCCQVLALLFMSVCRFCYHYFPHMVVLAHV